MEKESSGWGEAVGRMYRESALEERLHGGVSDDLITLMTTDGVPLYPERQFDVLPNGDLQRRDFVIRVWNTFIQPAIEEGHFDHWAGTYFLLQTKGQNQCPADTLSNPDTTLEEINHVLSTIQDGVRGFCQ